MSRTAPRLSPCPACPAPVALVDATRGLLCAHRTETVRTRSWTQVTWRRLCVWLKRYPTQL